MLVAFLVAIVTSSSTLAWAMPCCIHEEPEAAEATEAPEDSCCPGSASKEAPADETPDEHDDDAPCSCPVQCAPCCGGMPAPALLPLATLQQPSFAAWTTLELRYEERSPPDGSAHDVIHVPKR